MNDLKKYIERRPEIPKTWIAKQLGISRPTLDKWIERPTEQFTGVELAKVKALK